MIDWRPAYENLRSNQRQLDADGCEVGVSRQALDEVLNVLGPDTRILRRIPPRETWTFQSPPEGTGIKRAIILDTEATSTDPATAKLCELAMLPFDYSTANDSIVAVHEPKSWLQDPGEPLTEEVKEVTGLTDEILAGQQIDHEAVAATVGDAFLMVAHNAGYDRPLCERYFPLWAKDVAWACSMEELPWRRMGAPSRAMQVLAWTFGFFYDAHRAVPDCLALAYLLTRSAPDGRPLSAHLLASARQITHRIWATGSAFQTKDRLKQRGYRWNAAPQKCWYRNVPADRSEAEQEWLRTAVQVMRPDVEPMNAFGRYRGEAG